MILIFCSQLIICYSISGMDLRSASFGLMEKLKLILIHDDYIKIPLSQQLPAGKVKVKVAYGGKPAIAVRPPWTGGFQWDKDSKGNPWISITCQGEGAKIYFPCKDHPSDEPNEGAI
jgi:hypothetical protein